VPGPDLGREADQGQELAVSAPAASALASVALSWRTYYLRQPAVIRDGFWLAARMQCRINAAARRRYARTALELFTALLPDRQRIQGRDHPDTLAARHNIALWTGKAGRARDLFAALPPNVERVLAADHPEL
jgi:hypothetical protein